MTEDRGRTEHPDPEPGARSPKPEVSVFGGPDVPQRALIDACVHCGFCLPSCPTYVLWGEEMDSPRGRVYLMKAALEGRTTLSDTFTRHFDACLGCMACVTACPSGVQYGPLIERTRSQIEQHHQRAVADRLFRAVLFRVLPYPSVLRFALAPLAIGQWIFRLRPEATTKDFQSRREAASTPVASGFSRKIRGFLPARLRSLWELAPRITLGSLTGRVPERTAAVGARRLRVGMLSGCVQRMAFPEVNLATIRVLAAEGCEVIAPAQQGCCGALSRHSGRLEEARAFARRTIEIFERAGVDAVVVNAAGCGSSMKEYGDLLEDDAAWASRAHAFRARVRDISELLVELGEPRAQRHAIQATVAYHDACHLSHAQRVRTQPRALLAQIPGLTVVDIGEPDICCGSAGIYNLVQPEPAAALGDRKAACIKAVQPDIIATGNPGCTLQIAAACERIGFRRPVMHPIELLDRSIGGDSTAARRGVAAD
ncbi:MAG TPA: heterodisulfide reductase-related iron-sulfur binding cluster [Vicinamibacterales bacterium]